MLTVTKTILPDFNNYADILQRAWKKGYVTNNGELMVELEYGLRSYLQTKHLWYCSNGTIAIQMSIKALQLVATDEIITTPYSYVATANAIAWEQCQPVFVDINSETCCIDVQKLEQAITPRTRAILATHVYGLPCDVVAIEKIAAQYGLAVIYDGAHAFGVQYQGKSLLSFGDISTCSFHATKLFHTVEGGCVIAKDDALNRKLELYRQFGHIGEEYFDIGINAKNSELHAAMGLAILPMIGDMIEERAQLFKQYKKLLGGLNLGMLEPDSIEGLQWNYAYFPVFFENERVLLSIRRALEAEKIFTRRYFYPSLNTLPFYGESSSCPASEKIASTVLCLPFFNGLTLADQERVADIITKNL